MKPEKPDIVTFLLCAQVRRDDILGTSLMGLANEFTFPSLPYEIPLCAFFEARMPAGAMDVLFEIADPSDRVLVSTPQVLAETGEPGMREGTIRMSVRFNLVGVYTARLVVGNAHRERTLCVATPEPADDPPEGP